MAAGDVYQIGAVQVIDTVAMENVFFMKVVDDDGITNKLEHAANAFNSEIRPEMRAIQSTQLNHECTIIKKVSPTTDIAEVVLVDEDGLHSGEALPQNVGVILSYYGGNGDKNRRGRVFVPGVPENWVSDGRLIESVSTVMLNLGVAMAADITYSGAEYKMQVYSKKLQIFTDIAQALVRPVPTKVRRRTPGMCSLG